MEAIFIYIMNTFTFTKLKLWLAVSYSWFSYIIGWFDLMVESLYILLVMDFVLGFLHAWNTHTISKKRMQLGIIKIITYSVTLIVINYADISAMWVNFQWVWIRELWVAYLSINEALSCLHHLWKFWVPLPMWLIKKLEWYRESLDTTDIK